MSHAFVYLKMVQCTQHLTEHPLLHLEVPGKGIQPQAWLPRAGEEKREGGQSARLVMAPPRCTEPVTVTVPVGKTLPMGLS